MTAKAIFKNIIRGKNQKNPERGCEELRGRTTEMNKEPLLVRRQDVLQSLDQARDVNMTGLILRHVPDLYNLSADLPSTMVHVADTMRSQYVSSSSATVIQYQINKITNHEGLYRLRCYRFSSTISSQLNANGAAHGGRFL